MDDVEAWELSTAPAQAVRDAESVVLMARREHLKLILADPILSAEDRLAVGRELREMSEASYAMCKADLAELRALNGASRAALEGQRRDG